MDKLKPCPFCGGHEWLKGRVLPMPDDFYCADGERKGGEE